MFNFIKTSLRNRLLTQFIIIGFIPLIILIFYILFLSETKLLNKIITQEKEKIDNVVHLIDNHLMNLKKEVIFLSNLDIMNDILVDDLDKRISRLLHQKSKDLNLDLSFIVVNIDSSIILASSNTDDLLKTYSTITLKEQEHGSYIDKNQLYLYSKIYASFEKRKALGYLILKYNLKNLDFYLTHTNDTHSYIVNTEKNILIGEDLALNVNLNNETAYIIDKSYVIIYKKLTLLLDDFSIVYAVNKDVALEFVYDFINFMLYISLVIFVFILYIAIKQSKEIVKPIEELTSITDEIRTTHNYSKRLNINSQDEIATLSHSFNDMLQTTSVALTKLEEENTLRVKRFTQLIDTFNILIQTKTEQECIEVSINEINKLTNRKNLHFTKNKVTDTNKQYTDLYVNDFEKNKKVYFGSIDINTNDLQDKNEIDFYKSITSMITLQLDRIRLIENTVFASNAKSSFISHMSHELRTPLNAIIGFTQFMISYEELNEEQLETMGNIESSAQYLLGMINEILDIAKIEAGKMAIHIEKVDIHTLTEQVHSMLLPLARDKNIDLSFESKNFKNEYYYTDPKICKQILINLLSNAIKFTEQGSVSMSLFNKEQKIYFQIQDTGIGIKNSDLTRLFNDFTQLDNLMHKKYKGTGLGLSLSQKMAHTINGKIILQSDGINKGTTSTLILNQVVSHRKEIA